MRYGARQAYFETGILQADPIELVSLLYRGAIEAIAKARVSLKAGDIRERSRQITKACEILNELAGAVDREQGGELSAALVQLYDYIQRLLLDANFRQADPPLAEAENLLATILEGWEGIARAAILAPPPDNTHPASLSAV